MAALIEDGGYREVTHVDGAVIYRRTADQP
jgi:hypothetical protein